MTSKIRRWGNSLALRIPHAIAELSSLKQDSEVEIQVVDNKLVIEVVKKEKLRLEDLLAKITPANLHEAVDTGEPRGNEAW